MESAECVEIACDGLPCDGSVSAAHVAGQFAGSGGLPDCASEGLEEPTEVAWIASRTEPGDVHLDDVGEIVAEPTAGVLLICPDQFGPASDYDPVDQFADRSASCQPGCLPGCSG